MPEDKVIPVKVALRCRPLVTKEINEGCRCCLTFTSGNPQVILGQDRAFTYDYVFDPSTPQEAVYSDCVKNLVKGLFKGYNATVLAYGQTGSGKTFTMGGGYNVGPDQEEDVMGVIPRVIHDIFEGINFRQEKYNFVVKVTYLEIYKEELYDLFVPVTARDKDALAVREDPQRGVYIAGLQEQEVGNVAATMQLLEQGSCGRTTGSTAMNSSSSRSHAIFTIGIERASKTDSNDSCEAKFHLVDLAGSERAKKTGAEGERFKEGININRGLLALGNVISALGDDTQKRLHIPYRDSKLTRLLQDSLGGNSHTLMVACVSPADSNFEETLSTLRYADRARKIKNKPIVNRDPQAAEIMRLKALVQELQKQVVPGPSAENVSRSSIDSSVDFDLMKDVIKTLEEENGKLKGELINALHQNTSMCQKVVNLEGQNDKLQGNLEQLKEKTGLSLSAVEAHPEMQEKLQDIYAAIEAMEDVQNSKLDTSTGRDDSQANSSAENDQQHEMSTADILKEAQLKNKMFALNDELLRKEDLLREIQGNNTTFSAVQDKYQTELNNLQDQIDTLNKEKEELCGKLQAAKAATNSSKVSEQRRQRLKELEAKLVEMRKAHIEQSKLLRMKEAAAKDSTRLAAEIQNLKKQRVMLMKQMRVESEASRKWKMQKEKEVMQLKAKERKQQVHVTKLEYQHQRQQSMLRRKAEEAVAANRRLKEALAKQRQVAQDRTLKQERHDTNYQEKIKKWLDNELELVISVEEARHHLSQMISQRKDISKKLRDLKYDLQAPPSKKMLLNDSGSRETDSEKTTLKKRIKDLQQDMDIVNAQISETQQRIVEADQDEKAKTRWDSLRNMMDSRCALKILLEKAVKAQIERIEEASRAVEAEASAQDATTQLTTVESELAELRRNQERQVTLGRQETERKVTYFLKLLNQKMLSQEDVNAAGHLIKADLEKLSCLQDELEEKNNEVDKLETELSHAKVKSRKGDTQAYFSHLPSTPVFNLSQEDKKVNASRGSCQFDPIDWSDGDGDDDDKDPDWMSGQTPNPLQAMSKIQKKDGLSVANPTVRNSTHDVTHELACGCKTNCSTQRCRCMKGRITCTAGSCKCDPKLCTNNATDESQMQSTMNSTFIMSSTPAETSTEDSSSRENTVIIPTLKRSSSGLPKNVLTDSNRVKKDPLDSSVDDFVAPMITLKKKRKVTESFFNPPY